MPSISRKAFISCGWDSAEWKGGFNLTMETYLNGPISPKSGLIVNLTDLDKVLKDVITPFDHKHLQKDYPDLNFHSLESFARYCFHQISQHPLCIEWKYLSISLERLRIYYSPDQWVEVLAD